MYHTKNENFNVKTCQYISPKFLFWTAHEGSQNIQTIKRDLRPTSSHSYVSCK